jgi:hypothetical protein
VAVGVEQGLAAAVGEGVSSEVALPPAARPAAPEERVGEEVWEADTGMLPLTVPLPAGVAVAVAARGGEGVEEGVGGAVALPGADTVATEEGERAALAEAVGVVGALPVAQAVGALEALLLVQPVPLAVPLPPAPAVEVPLAHSVALPAPLALALAQAVESRESVGEAVCEGVCLELPEPRAEAVLLPPAAVLLPPRGGEALPEAVLQALR